MPRVFISHASADREFVERDLIPLFRDHGVETWYSKDQIQTTAEWQGSIIDGLEACDWFLVVMSPRAVASRWVRAEVLWAIDQRPEGRIIPVLLEECNRFKIHMQLPLIQHVNFSAQRPDARRQLLAVFGLSLQTAPPPPPPAPEVVADGSDDLARLLVERAIHRNAVAVPGESAAGYALIRLIATEGQVCRPPVNDHVFVVDVTSSMYSKDGTGSSRLRRIQNALLKVVEQQLPVRDSLALVAYGDTTEVVLPSTSLANKETIAEAIGRLHQTDADPTGRAMGAAMKVGLDLLDERAGTKGFKELTIVTCGETSDEPLCRDLATFAAQKKYWVNVMGFGTEWNAQLIKDMARLSQGNWFYIDAIQPQAVEHTLNRGFEYLTVNAFTNVELHLQPFRGVRIKRLWDLRIEGPRDIALSEVEERHLKAELGPIAPGQTNNYLLELSLPKRDDGRYVLARFTVDYDAGGYRESTYSVDLVVNYTAAGNGPLNPAVGQAVQDLKEWFLAKRHNSV